MESIVNPLDILKEQMDSDDLAIRVNAVHRAQLISVAMTPQTVRSQLIPYLQSLVKKQDDQVLFAIAQVLGNIAMTLGNLQFSVLPCLQILAGQQQTVVRDQAVKSILNILKNSNDQQITTHFVPLLNRLATNNLNFTCRLSAVNLITKIYPRAGSFKQRLRNKFTQLCSQQAPMIRRLIATKIGQLASGYQKEHVISQLIPSFKGLCGDQQDQVRVLCLDSLKSWANLLSREQIKTHMMPLIIQAQQDKSWRVRLALAKNLSEIAQAFGKQITDVNLIQIFSNILKDAQNDVRIQAVRSLVRFVKVVSSQKLNILLIHINNICKDAVSQVRYGAAEVISNLAGLVGKQIAMKLLPSLVSMITDENQDVRQKGISGSCKFAQIYGIQSVGGIIQLFSRQMQQDKKWRVRYQLILAVSNLAITFKNLESFMKHLEPIFTLFLKDRAAQVRQLGVQRLSQLLSIYKGQFAYSMLNKITQIYNNKQTPFHIRKCALSTLKPLLLFMTPENSNQKILPLLQKSLTDPIPNIRFITFKIIKDISTRIDNASLKQQLKNMCQIALEDPDSDAKYYAHQALNSL